MNIEQMESRMENWMRFIVFTAGASASLLLVEAVYALEPHRLLLHQAAAWFAVWLLIQSMSLFPAVLLILGKTWRSIPIPFRFQAVFGSLAASVLALGAFGLRLQDQSYPYGSIDYKLLVLIVGLILAVMYLYLRKKFVTAPEAMFP